MKLNGGGAPPPRSATVYMYVTVAGGGTRGFDTQCGDTDMYRLNEECTCCQIQSFKLFFKLPHINNETPQEMGQILLGTQWEKLQRAPLSLDQQ